MKTENGYYVDDNNNRWDASHYTQEQAEQCSKTLVNCASCVNRIDCRNCHDCSYCRGCHDCSGCRDCHGCYDCYDCSGCRDCSDCSDCHNCRNCRNCHGCHDYIKQPQIYVTDKIGSRNDNTYFYYGETKDGMSLQVVCGCFKGDLEEFARAVEKTHKNTEFFEQYDREIQKVKILFEL